MFVRVSNGKSIVNTTLNIALSILRYSKAKWLKMALTKEANRTISHSSARIIPNIYDIVLNKTSSHPGQIKIKVNYKWVFQNHSCITSFSVNSPSFRCVFLVWDVLTFWDEFARKLANYLWIYHLKLQESVITCNWWVYFGTTLSLGVVISRNIVCNKFMTMLDRHY